MLRHELQDGVSRALIVALQLHRPPATVGILVELHEGFLHCGVIGIGPPMLGPKNRGQATQATTWSLAPAGI